MKAQRPIIEIGSQPPQSPCMNLCDLGFFKSIDSRLPKLRAFSLPQFIGQIKGAFDVYPSEKLESLACMKSRILGCVIEHDGGNDFKVLQVF